MLLYTTVIKFPFKNMNFCLGRSVFLCNKPALLINTRFCWLVLLLLTQLISRLKAINDSAVEMICGKPPIIK